MKKYLIAASIILPIFSHASLDPFKLNPSLKLFKYPASTATGCDSLHFRIDDQEIHGTYKTKAEFPKASELVILGKQVANEEGLFEISCPKLSAKFDGNIYEFKSDSYQNLWTSINVKNGIPLYSTFGYKYPTIKVDPWSEKIGFDPITFQLFSDNRMSVALHDREFASYTDVVIGYKVNDGKLQPLLYNGKLTPKYQDVFKKANIIQLFYKSDDTYHKPNYQSVYINKSDGLIRIYKEFPFPNE